MVNEMRAVCPENDALVEHMRKWWKDHPKKGSENIEFNVNKALTNVCRHDSHITTLKQFSSIKGIGKWITKEMQEFFKTDCSENESSPAKPKGKKNQGTRKYIPQKNSAAYALLITLYREEMNGVQSMRKQELIDAAEASGLSRGPIAPEKGSGKKGHIGSSSREWYSGWSAMKTLIDKGLVSKSSSPAKYMLSDEGRRIAIECLSRSGMLDSTQSSISRDGLSDSEKQDVDVLEVVSADSPKKVTITSVDVKEKNVSKVNISAEYLDKFTRLGYSREKVLNAWAEVSMSSSNKEMSALWLTVLCKLREDEIYGVQPELQATSGSSSGDAPNSNKFAEGVLVGQKTVVRGLPQTGDILTKSCPNVEIREASLASEYRSQTTISGSRASQNVLRMPHLEQHERFEDVYKVILVLDDREQFTRPKLANIVESIRKEFKIEIEVKRLPVGDAIWIARHKQLHTSYVLDFIVERKDVDDLRSSIMDGRYNDQKLRLLKTGLKKIIYVVEGDPNSCQGGDAVKTACFTTEILEGFDLQRTTGLKDTLRRYGFLTWAIADQYKLNAALADNKTTGKCLRYDQFIKQCEDDEKMTVSDVFASQLMQVPQVTEEIAIAVLDCYPTLYSLVSAYSDLDGDIRAQEELLMKQRGGAISAAASRNIYRFIWGN